MSDNIAAPAPEHSDVAAAVSEQLEVTPRRQHFGAEAELRCNFLIQRAKFLHKGCFRGIRAPACVDRRCGVRNLRGANTFKQFGAAVLEDARGKLGNRGKCFHGARHLYDDVTERCVIENPSPGTVALDGTALTPCTQRLCKALTRRIQRTQAL